MSRWQHIAMWQADPLALRILIITYGSVKYPDAGKDWKQEEKGATEDEMASPTQWTWVWASSRRQWRTEKPGVLQSMGSQRVGHSWATEQLRKVPTAMWQLPGWGNRPASSSPLKSHLTRASVRTEQTKGRERCFVNNCHNNLHLMRAYSVQAMWLFREALPLKPPPPLSPPSNHHQVYQFYGLSVSWICTLTTSQV